MSPDVYEQFAVYILSSLAERRNRNGQKLRRGQHRREYVSGEPRPIPLSGEGICYQPDARFRDSDASFRITMAVRAMEKAHQIAYCSRPGANWWACVRVAELIMKSRCQAFRDRFLKG